MSKSSDYNIEQQIYLGGQASEKHEDLKQIALLGSYAEIYILMKHWLEIKAIRDKRERVLKVIEYLGMVDFMSTCTELTKLSAIMGDTRKRYSMKKRDITDVGTDPASTTT